MTPREIALLTAAKLEHEGHEVSQAEQREIEREVMSSIRLQERHRAMMNAPAYQWKKPNVPRR